MINKTKGSYPSNEIGKTSKDQRIIRPVDLNKVIDEINTNIKPYKTYVATMAQSGGANPTVEVLQNDFSGPIVWVRTGGGVYTGTLAGAFTVNKTWTNITIAIKLNGDEAVVDLVRQDANTVLIDVFDSSFSVTDTFNANLEIRVYS